MCVWNWFALAAVVGLILYVVVLLFVDCDLGLAWAEKYGKSIDTLAGKVVWITGASSGIGEHLAVALARGGVKLVLSARRENELERVKENCLRSGKNLTDRDVLVLPMDVLSVDKHKDHFQQVINHFGKLDILVNNAGRGQRADWEETDLAVDKELFDLNVFAVISLSRIAVQYFQKKKEGHIVVTSSIAALHAIPFTGSYSASKCALHGYYKALRVEKLLHNIKVTLLCPGPVYTNIIAESFTTKHGEMIGEEEFRSSIIMTGERCGYLCAVAIANNLNEAWMAVFPLIPLYYVLVYCPNVVELACRIAPNAIIRRLRKEAHM